MRIFHANRFSPETEGWVTFWINSHYVGLTYLADMMVHPVLHSHLPDISPLLTCKCMPLDLKLHANTMHCTIQVHTRIRITFVSCRSTWKWWHIRMLHRPRNLHWLDKKWILEVYIDYLTEDWEPQIDMMNMQFVLERINLWPLNPWPLSIQTTWMKIT